MDIGNLEELPQKVIKTTSAKYIADVVSIRQDLTHVVWLTNELTRLLDLAAEEGRDARQIQAYSSAALITYRRCFAEGKRYGLKAEALYKKLKGEPMLAHKYFYDQASKLVAHSVNPFEDVIVSLLTKDGEVVGVSENSMRRISESKEGLQTLRNLCFVCLEYAESEIKVYEKKLLIEAKELSKSELKQLKSPRFTIPGPESAGAPR